VCVFQLNVIVRDNVTASQTDTATVTVSIRRNVHVPIFTQNVYNVQISEYHENNDIVTTVSASDLDSPTSSSGILRYQINNTIPTSTLPFFTISQTTGQIYLARALTNDASADQYTVILIYR